MLKYVRLLLHKLLLDCYARLLNLTKVHVNILSDSLSSEKTGHAKISDKCVTQTPKVQSKELYMCLFVSP